MTDLLVVGLSSWIIMDGNYRNFSRGADAAFALEFYASTPLEQFEPESAQIPVLRHTGSALYEIQGQVAHLADDWWVIDAGILIYREERPPANGRQGGWLRGNIWIGIDPFFYFERLAHQPGAPALIYDWKIVRIEVQTAPLIETRPRVMERDPTRLGWREIAATEAWHDEGDYLLHCKRRDGTVSRMPRSRRAP
jgi:hypothetical protein